jgi:ABC-2 type transport system ATP-binding protein
MSISVSNSAKDLGGRIAAAFPHMEFQAVSPELIRVESGGPINIAPLVRFIEEQGAEVTEARRVRPSLEEVFVRVTGIELNIMRKEKGGGG